MQSILIDFLRFDSPCDGEHIRLMLTEILDEWKWKNRLAAITTDNGS